MFKALRTVTGICKCPINVSCCLFPPSLPDVVVSFFIISLEKMIYIYSCCVVHHSEILHVF